MATLTNTDAKVAYTACKKAFYKVGARYGRTFDANQVADMSQVVMIRLIESFDPERGTIGQIAYVTACNVAADHCRGKNYAGGSTMSQLPASEDDEGNMVEYDIPDNGPSAVATLMLAERQSALESVLGTISTTERSAISAALDGSTALTGSQRIAQMRGINKIKGLEKIQALMSA